MSWEEANSAFEIVDLLSVLRNVGKRFLDKWLVPDRHAFGESGVPIDVSERSCTLGSFRPRGGGVGEACRVDEDGQGAPGAAVDAGAGRDPGSAHRRSRRAGVSRLAPGVDAGEQGHDSGAKECRDRASGHGFRSSFKDWARQHDVDELLSEFALAHVEGSATVAAYARDDLLEKRRPVMQRWG